MKLLVVGARPGSLGAAVKDMAQESQFGWEVVTVGMSNEDHWLEFHTETQATLEQKLRDLRPDAIVCTAGINRPRRATHSTKSWYEDHFAVNVIGPMRLLDAWLSYGPDTDVPWPHFVAISSNSARIPRGHSAAYCASKAALSMAIQCRARDVARVNQPMSIYAYEPGLIQGTPMTNETERRFPGQPLHRMLGVGLEDGLSAHGLAGHVVRNIAFGGPELNGVCLRLDAGEV